MLCTGCRLAEGCSGNTSLVLNKSPAAHHRLMFQASRNLQHDEQSTCLACLKSGLSDVAYLLKACMHFLTGFGADQARHLAAVSTEHLCCLIKHAHLHQQLTLSHHLVVRQAKSLSVCAELVEKLPGLSRKPAWIVQKGLS